MIASNYYFLEPLTCLLWLNRFRYIDEYSNSEAVGVEEAGVDKLAGTWNFWTKEKEKVTPQRKQNGQAIRPLAVIVGAGT